MVSTSNLHCLLLVVSFFYIFTTNFCILLRAIEALKGLSNLENLNLQGNPICDHPEYILKVRHLKKLWKEEVFIYGNQQQINCLIDTMSLFLKAESRASIYSFRLGFLVFLTALKFIYFILFLFMNWLLLMRILLLCEQRRFD